MDSPKLRMLPVLLALLLVVFCAAFFLGRNTVSGRLSVEISRSPSVAPAEAVQAVRAVPEAETAPTVVNLNTAGLDELITLPGIGQTLAERILAYREEYGRFSATEQIMDVPGIGAATYAAIAGQITVEDGT